MAVRAALMLVVGAMLVGPSCQRASRAAAPVPAAESCAVPRPPVCGPPAVTARPIADHVIILSEDGLRPDALMRAKAPVHERLMREGAYTLRARTIRQASTLPSHAAMLSGVDVAAHGLSWNSWQPARGFIRVPTVFSIVSDAGHTSAAFVGKRKLEHIVQPGSMTVFSNPGFLCAKVVQQAADHFREHHPQIEFVHFSDPDERGHSIGWMSDEQLLAIQHTDRCLKILVDAIEAGGESDRTLLIISADHGGRGKNHSGSREEDRLIPWIVWGAGVKKGHRIDGLVSTVDTAATALWSLGYPLPTNEKGRAVTEAFLETAP